MGNSFGKILSLTSFGESHGTALGAVIDGVPPKLLFSLEKLQERLDRRSPGVLLGTSSRREPDKAIVLSGIFEERTLGTPIAVVVFNSDQRSEDYRDFKTVYRPGHADRTTLQKYGIRDHRGGGRSSGRETLARVMGGYFASLILPSVTVRAYASSLGPFLYDGPPPKEIGPYGFPDLSKTQDILNYLLDLQKKGAACGGHLTVVIENCPEGLGGPVFDKLKADLAKALLSIGGVTSFAHGLGISPLREGPFTREDFGGIEGGISNGDTIMLQITLRPPSTVGARARAGRHDPCLIPRAIPVAEAMVHLVLADHFLRQKAITS